MGLRRRIHFSFHDTRCFMTLEPFAINDKGIFVNPVTVELHRCQVQLPIDNLQYVSEGSINNHTLGRCDLHTCCVVWIIDQRCSKCSEDSPITDCPFFMVGNEYIPYESAMSGLSAAPPNTNPVSPRWVADLPQFPELFYSGHRFDERPHIIEADVDASRRALFSTARDILIARRDLARRIQHRQQCFHRILTAEADICQTWGPQLHHLVCDLKSDIKAAKKLASITAEALVYARRLFEASGLPLSTIKLWKPNWRGPLIKDLERLATFWSQLVEMWQELRE
ncbi:hypothetical protein F5Y06DRAFT_211421 [Hypoxylon sp. FL0890]|nr:hypothetical protein F5Y06DRAFT_211421 [Hypoxylon sp. FL0890]